MIKKQAVKDETQVAVTFYVTDLGHSQPIALVGDFNGWDPTATPLANANDGGFTVTLVLDAQCRYEFRYCDARGQWFNDEEADDYCDTDTGAINSVVIT